MNGSIILDTVSTIVKSDYHAVVFDILRLGNPTLIIENNSNDNFTILNAQIMDLLPGNEKPLMVYGKYANYEDEVIVLDIYELYLFNIGNLGECSVDIFKVKVIQSITYCDDESRPLKTIINIPSRILETSYTFFDKENIINSLVTKQDLFNIDNLIYSYDEVENITHKLTLSSSVEILESLNYCYDGMSRVVSEKRYIEGNTFDYYNEYTYDSNGNILIRSDYNVKNESITKLEYKYDNLIKDRLHN